METMDRKKKILIIILIVIVILVVAGFLYFKYFPKGTETVITEQQKIDILNNLNEKAKINPISDKEKTRLLNILYKTQK